MSSETKPNPEGKPKLDPEQVKELKGNLTDFVAKTKGSESAPPISDLRCNHSSHVNGGQ